MDRTEHLWRTLASVAEWTRFGDAKAVVALTADAVVVTALTQAVFNRAARQELLILVVASLAVLMAAASGLFALLAVIPNFAGGPPGSSLYFARISEYPDSSSYADEAMSVFADDDQTAERLCGLIWTLSRRGYRKYLLVRWAIRCLVVAGGLALPPFILAA